MNLFHLKKKTDLSRNKDIVNGLGLVFQAPAVVATAIKTRALIITSTTTTILITITVNVVTTRT